MRNISVIENDTGLLVATIPVVLRSFNSEVTNEDYFEEAWKCVVEDRLADANDKLKFTFSFI